MLRGHDIICVSSIDWDFLWQQHQEIMSTFARRGNRVLFIENTGVRAPRFADMPRVAQRIRNWRRGLRGFRQEREGLYVYSPLVLPFPHSRLARRVNRRMLVSSVRRWMRSAGFREPIIWTFLPTWVTLDLADGIDHRALVYYCSDNFAATSREARKVVRAEQEVIRRADVVFAMAANMVDYCRRFNERVVAVPMGVRADLFEGVRDADDAMPADLRDVPRPIVGYVGGVRQWIDQEMVERVARAHPEWSFVFVGPVQTDVSRLAACPNVHLLGVKAHEEIPRYVKAFDCCLLPYAKTEYTDSVSPAKLHEYLIMGKPVVSTALAEVERLVAEPGDHELVYVAKDAAGFEDAIARALAERGEHAAARIALARTQAWTAKIETMSACVEERLEARARDAQGFWQDRFRTMRRTYRQVRLKLVGTLASAAIMYVAVFHTPLAWMAAEPLRLDDAPSAADAIVVLGGGVGESGRSGEGYVERVLRAVELYRAGFASHVVFSSGTTHMLQEAVLMRGLAVELGVPADAILIEDRARNTFQNVTHVRAILDDHGWRRVLMVSSPYHMRRLSLVVRKADPGREVRYAAVAQSRFYARPRDAAVVSLAPQITLSQLGGILHEYAGIVAYWKDGLL